MPIIYIASVALSALMTVGMVLHFNAFPANHQEQNFGVEPRVQVVSQGSLGTSTSPVAGDLVMSWANGSYGPTSLIAGSGVTLSTSTYRQLTISAGAGFSYPFPGNATTTTLTFSNGLLSTASTTIHASSTITGVLTASGGIFGNLTGLASLATALNANGANCSAGSGAGGVDASGAAEDCTDYEQSLTAGDALTRTGDDFDFDGGTAPSGELGGTWGAITIDDNIIESEHFGDDDWGDITIASNAAAVEDDSHAHTATTITAANLTATDTSITFSGTYNGSTARTIGVNLGHAFVWTSTHDFGGATSVEMVNAASPTVDAIGEFALDLTENEILVATSTNAAAPIVIKPYEWKGFSHASSSQGSGSTTKPFFIAPPNGAGYFDSITCHTNSFLRVLLKDEAGNRMNDLVASSTEGNVKLFQNKDFTAGEVILVDIGTTTAPSSNVYLSCWTKIFWTRN
jgi:hypothetical protein